MKVKVLAVNSIELKPETDAEEAILEVIAESGRTVLVSRGHWCSGYGKFPCIKVCLTFEEPPKATLTLPIQDAKLRTALESCGIIERAIDAAVAKGIEAMAREIDREKMGPPGPSHSGSPRYPQEAEEPTDGD